MGLSAGAFVLSLKSLCATSTIYFEKIRTCRREEWRGEERRGVRGRRRGE